MQTQILKGQAALDALMAIDPEMPDWQAKKVLATARNLGLTNIPVRGGREVMCVKHVDGHFHLGDADFSMVGRQR